MFTHGAVVATVMTSSIPFAVAYVEEESPIECLQNHPMLLLFLIPIAVCLGLRTVLRYKLVVDPAAKQASLGWTVLGLGQAKPTHIEALELRRHLGTRTLRSRWGRDLRFDYRLIMASLPGRKPIVLAADPHASKLEAYIERLPSEFRDRYRGQGDAFAFREVLDRFRYH